MTSTFAIADADTAITAETTGERARSVDAADICRTVCSVCAQLSVALHQSQSVVGHQLPCRLHDDNLLLIVVFSTQFYTYTSHFHTP